MDELTGLDNLQGNEGLPSNPERPEALKSPSHLDQPNSGEKVLNEKVLTQGLHFNEWVKDFEIKKDFVPALDASTKQKGIVAKLGLASPVRLSRKVISQIRGQQSIEILQVANLCQNYSECLRWGWIDAPKLDARFEGGVIEVRGWLVGKQVQPTAIRFINRQTVIAETPIRIPRPGVIKAHFYDLKFSNCGYQTHLDLRSFSGETEITLDAVFDDGSTAAAGIISLYKYG
ncbi:MAG TPA: hypothetical protein V6C84_19965 [Coleofasciculaceae cyanobacterium]|jgi:hypothetical protein